MRERIEHTEHRRPSVSAGRYGAGSPRTGETTSNVRTAGRPPAGAAIVGERRDAGTAAPADERRGQSVSAASSAGGAEAS